MPARQASGYCILVPPHPQAHCKHEKYTGRGCQPFFEQKQLGRHLLHNGTIRKTHVAMASASTATWLAKGSNSRKKRMGITPHSRVLERMLIASAFRLLRASSGRSNTILARSERLRG